MPRPYYYYYNAEKIISDNKSLAFCIKYLYIETYLLCIA